MISNSLLLLVAQGLGVGRAPVAPGTFGSVVGIGWFALLLWSSSAPLFVTGAVLGVAASVWFGTHAERLLGQKDPSSVVLDEIAAVPLCFAALLAVGYYRDGRMPALDFFFGEHGWIWTVGVFAGFRFFDIVKPWPIRQTQRLAGGWGITLDDLLAAVYVNVFVLIVCSL